MPHHIFRPDRRTVMTGLAALALQMPNRSACADATPLAEAYLDALCRYLAFVSYDGFDLTAEDFPAN